MARLSAQKGSTPYFFKLPLNKDLTLPGLTEQFAEVVNSSE